MLSARARRYCALRIIWCGNSVIAQVRESRAFSSGMKYLPYILIVIGLCTVLFAAISDELALRDARQPQIPITRGI